MKQQGAEEKTGQDAAKAQSCILGQEIRTALHEVHDSPHDNNEVLTQLLGISGKAGSGAKCKGFITIGVKHSNAIVKLPWGVTSENLCSKAGPGLLGGWLTFRGLAPPSEKVDPEISPNQEQCCATPCKAFRKSHGRRGRVGFVLNQ